MHENRLVRLLTYAVLGGVIYAVPSLADTLLPHNGAAHVDPIAPVVLGATAILFFALIGRFASRSLGQPPVVGELIMGMLIGNLAGFFNYELMLVLREGSAIFDTVSQSLHGQPLAPADALALSGESGARALEILQGPSGAEVLLVAHVVDIFARYGALFLLFYVGLETRMEELRQVGAESSGVAVVGVIAPFALGIALIWLMLPEMPVDSRLFVASTLAATSVGITASVLEDIGQQHSHEARVILGAAVIDDILGLVLLAIIAGIVTSGSLNPVDALSVIFRAAIFLIGAVTLGPLFLRTYISAAGRLQLVEAKLFVSIIFAMGMAWVASLFGLAPIIGAFAGGVILSDGYFRHWTKTERRRYRITDLIMPLEMILVPFFFVLMGIQVKLERFADWQVLKMSLALVVVAMAGKLLAGLLAHKGTNRWVVGIGMMPRGEVGLVFAAIGKSLGVIGDAIFSAVVLMVMVTTLLAPVLLKWAYRRPPDLTMHKIEP